ncbi:MAG: hypothetical protein O2944_03055 [Proteobacteria bacterium]|nr:hypothetical protein [Pseudomonadota bacterium]
MSVLHAWPDDESKDPRRFVDSGNRKGRRVSGPKLAVALRGKLYESVNWSLAGILIEGYDGALVEGDSFEIDGVGPAGRSPWPALISARVVRLGGKSGTQMAAQFLTLSVPAYDILEGILLRRSEFRIS